MITAGRPISATEVSQHYDSLDQFYREIWGEHIHHGLWRNGDETPQEAVLTLVHHIASLAHLPPKANVLDVGCGYGTTARMLAHDYGATVHGWTISSHQYAYARDHPNNSSHVHFELLDFFENEEPAGTFDTVVAIEVLEHIADKPRFFQECRRLLKPGGTLVASAWAAGRNPSRIDRRLLLEPICREGHLPNLPSGGEFVSFSQEAGLHVSTAQEESDRVKKTWGICMRRMVHGLMTNPAYLSFLRDTTQQDRAFVLTVLRMMVAYRRRALTYWVFSAHKPKS